MNSAKKPLGWIIAASAVAAVVGGAIAATFRPQTNQSVVVSDSPSPVVSPSLATSPSVSPTMSATATPVASPATPQNSPSPATAEKLSPQSKVTIYGIGPVRVGMTVQEASAAAGVPLVTDGGEASPDCRYYRPADMADLGFMVIDGRIARVDVWNQNSAKTRSGLGIGSTKTDIEKLFPGQIQEAPHEYVPGGQYLIFVPKDSADQNYRIIFETDPQGRVTQYRAGKLPEVRWIEGCA